MTGGRRAQVLAVLLGAIAGGAGVAVEACGGGGEKPPPLATQEGGGGDVANHSDAPVGSESGRGDAAGDDGAAVGEGSADSPALSDGTTDGGEGAPPEDVTLDTVVLGPDGGALCDIGTIWGAPTQVLTTAAADTTIFGGVTPDELTLVWISRTAGAVTVWYADRASVAVAFGTPLAVPTALGAFGMDRVTVSGDGLRIGGVAPDGLSLVGVTRTSRSTAFAAADKEFSAIGGSVGGETPPTLASPLLAGDDSALFYLVTSASSDYAIHESRTGLPTWKGGPSLAVTQLARSGTSYRRPSGVSLDGLTLFYWDEVSGSEGMATRPVLTQPFNQFAALGARVNASPAASCRRIYYALPAGDASSAGALAIVYADSTTAGD